jgi:hypothetical protein
VPAFEFRFAFFRLCLLQQSMFVSQRVHERTGVGSKGTLSLTCGRSRNAKVFKQFLLRIDDTSSFCNTIRK